MQLAHSVTLSTVLLDLAGRNSARWSSAVLYNTAVSLNLCNVRSQKFTRVTEIRDRLHNRRRQTGFVKSVVDHQSALRVTRQSNLGRRALLQGLIDELHQVGSARCTHVEVAFEVGRVVDALECDVLVELRRQGRGEWWPNDRPNVAGLGCAASEDDGQRCADAVLDISGGVASGVFRGAARSFIDGAGKHGGDQGDDQMGGLHDEQEAAISGKGMDWRTVRGSKGRRKVYLYLSHQLPMALDKSTTMSRPQPPYTTPKHTACTVSTIDAQKGCRPGLYVCQNESGR